jgi:hypothetical protein
MAFLALIKYSQVLSTDGAGSESHVAYDPFQMSTVAQAIPNTTQYNPYLDDNTNLGTNGAAYFQTPSAFIAPGQPVK